MSMMFYSIITVCLFMKQDSKVQKSTFQRQGTLWSFRYIYIFLFSCLELDFLLSGCIRENGCQKLNNALNLESSYKWIMINQ